MKTKGHSRLSSHKHRRVGSTEWRLGSLSTVVEYTYIHRQAYSHNSKDERL